MLFRSINFFSGYRYHQYDNFFEAASSTPQTNVRANELFAGATTRFGSSDNWKANARVGYVKYDQGIDPSTDVFFGTRGSHGSHSVDAGINYQIDRPNSDTGNGVRTADNLILRGEYGYNITAAWKFSLLADYQDQDVATGGDDNQLYLVGGAIRFNGWKRKFSPEIGYKIGQRNSDDPSNDNDQWQTWLKVRSQVTHKLYLSARFRYGERDYTVSNTTSSNFNREDERRQWTLGANYNITKMFSVDFYYANLDADSTKSSRVFDSETFMLGIKAAF